MAWELRWFFKGSVPDDVAEWIEGRLGKSEKGEHRTDYYFMGSGCDAFGLKGREGKIEVKWRTRGFQAEITSSVHGEVEDWTKLGWKDPENPPDDTIRKYLEEHPDDPWLQIEKIRSQWRCREVFDGDWAAVEKKLDGNGFLVELTDITVRNEGWWSLAFDLFPQEDENIKELLTTGVAWLLRDYSGPPLGYEDSCGYPKWLALL